MTFSGPNHELLAAVLREPARLAVSGSAVTTAAAASAAASACASAAELPRVVDEDLLSVEVLALVGGAQVENSKQSLKAVITF